MQLEAQGYNIIVNHINLTNNKLPAGNFTLKPVIQRKVGRLDNQENGYAIELSVTIENTEETAFPINLDASITGIFLFNQGTEEERIEYLNYEGVRIVFPYLRTLVANVTASSLMPSVMLPLISPSDFKQDNVMQMKKPA